MWHIFTNDNYKKSQDAYLSLIHKNKNKTQDNYLSIMNKKYDGTNIRH